MKTNQYIIDYYDNYNKDNRLNPRHGTVGFLTTIRYIKKYIESGSRILEIGAGTGRHSHALTHQGYMVDAVELVLRNIEVFRRHMLSTEHTTITQGNALDLSAFPDNRCDITLPLGPLYHLYSKEEKRRVLGEAICVTKQGGIIFAAYVISDDCLSGEGSNHGNIDAAEYIKNRLLGPETFATKSEPKDLFELIRKEGVDDLMSIFPTTHLHYAAADDCAPLVREVIDKMDDETFKLYLKYHYAACERKNLTGITSRAIDIFQK